MMSPVIPAWAAGAATSSVSTMTTSSLGIGAATLAALSGAPAGAHGGQRAPHPGRPVGVRMPRRDGLPPSPAEPRPQLRVAVQPPQRRGQRAGVAGRDDEPGLLVADEAARGGPDPGGRHHGNPL